MQRFAWLSLILVTTAGIPLAAGCGRPTLPGQQFQGERRAIPGAVATDTPHPPQPNHTWGPEEAKVRVVAFYPIDEPHQGLIDLLKGLATEEYPGKLYARCVDYRTPEGRALFSRAELQVAAILINGENSIDLKTATGVRTVDFVKDMGRYWTADDLREAVAQAIAEGYGAESTSRK